MFTLVAGAGSSCLRNVHGLLVPRGLDINAQYHTLQMLHICDENVPMKTEYGKPDGFIIDAKRADNLPPLHPTRSLPRPYKKEEPRTKCVFTSTPTLVLL